MSAITVKSVALVNSVDAGIPTTSDFTIVESTIDPETVEVPIGGLLVTILVVSADPYLRGLIRSNSAFKPNGIISGFVAGKVLKVNQVDKWVEGDLFGGNLPFSTHQILSAASVASIWKLSEFIDESDISAGIGILGMPGATAFGGLCDVLRPEPGETIFVSAAAGAVGGLVASIAKTVYGLRVIGSCGGEDKVKLLQSSGHFDEVIDYKKHATAEELTNALRTAAPKGVDMYFENVGGIHFEAALAVLNDHGRVAVCGQISEYNEAKPKPLSLYALPLIYKSHRVEGFLSSSWLSGRIGQGKWIKDLDRWYKEGKISKHETVTEGIENWSSAFISLFEGTNIGKVVVRV